MLTLDAGGTTAAVRWARKGLRLLEHERGAQAAGARAALTAALAGIRQRQGRMEEAIVLCRSAIAEGEAAGEDLAVARASYVLDWALVESGRPREGGHSERALALLRRLGDLNGESTVLNNMGGFAYREGRWPEAIELWEASADAARRAGDLMSAAYGAVNVGEITSDAGRLEEADVHLRRALQVFRGTGNAWAIAYSEALLGRLEVRAGRTVAGRERLTQAAEGFARLKAEQDGAWVAALSAEADMVIGADEAAAREAGRLLAEQAGGPRLVPMLERVLALTAKDREAREAALDRALVSARTQADALEIAFTLDVTAALGLAGEDDVSERGEIATRLGIERLPTALPARLRAGHAP